MVGLAPSRVQVVSLFCCVGSSSCTVGTLADYSGNHFIYQNVYSSVMCIVCYLIIAVVIRGDK